MSPLAQALVLAFVAGIAIPVGGWLALVPHLVPRWLERPFRHFAIAFGGGALLAAVALVLLPESMAALPAWGTMACFIGGGVAFCLADAWIARRGGAMGQFLAMLLVIALGAAFAHGSATGTLLALLIALQNLPEGFNACREMVAADHGRHHRVLVVFAALAGAGPVAAWLGWTVFDEQPTALGAIMATCAGGILYLCFQDIAPQARQRHHWSPPLGAVAGFALGLLGHLVIVP